MFLSVSLSVRTSQIADLLKQLNVGSRKRRHTLVDFLQVFLARDAFLSSEQLEVMACIFRSNYLFHVIADGLKVCTFSGVFFTTYRFAVTRQGIDVQ